MASQVDSLELIVAEGVHVDVLPMVGVEPDVIPAVVARGPPHRVTGKTGLGTMTAQ